MVFTRTHIRQKLEQAFNRQQAEVLAEVVEVAYNDLVKTSDFNELKAIVRDLAEAQKRTEGRVEELAEAQKRTEVRVEELAEAQKRTEGRVGRLETVVEELAEAQKRTEQELHSLTRVVHALQNTQSSMKGDLLELRYRQHAAAYFGPALRRVRVLTAPELDDEFEARLSLPAYQDLLQANLVVCGQPRQQPDISQVWLVVEVSSVIDRQDVQRALRRVGYLRQVGYKAIPVVAGERSTKGGQSLAEREQVVLMLDGQMAFWEDALAGQGGNNGPRRPS